MKPIERVLKDNNNTLHFPVDFLMFYHKKIDTKIGVGVKVLVYSRNSTELLIKKEKWIYRGVEYKSLKAALKAADKKIKEME